jgi:uncharacterized protein YlzI (FlbEa/FlbD family)
MTTKIEFITGERYRICGEIENGYFNGKPLITNEQVIRCIRYITDTHVVCECGRRFLINEKLKIEKV